MCDMEVAILFLILVSEITTTEVESIEVLTKILLSLQR